MLLRPLFEDRLRERQAQDEHVQWIRDQRLRAYHEFYTVAQQILQDAQSEEVPYQWGQDHDGWMRTAEKLSQDISRSYWLLMMVGGDTVRDAGGRLRDASNLRLLLTVPQEEDELPPGTVESRNRELTEAHGLFLMAARHDLRVDSDR
jgi:hypothetical protein